MAPERFVLRSDSPSTSASRTCASLMACVRVPTTRHHPATPPAHPCGASLTSPARGPNRARGPRNRAVAWSDEAALRRDRPDAGSLPGLDPVMDPDPMPRDLFLYRLQGDSIGETGFEPATARPPAGRFWLRGSRSSCLERFRVVLSWARLRSIWTPDWTPSGRTPDKLQTQSCRSSALRPSRTRISPARNARGRLPARRRGPAGGLPEGIRELSPYSLRTDAALRKGREFLARCMAPERLRRPGGVPSPGRSAR
jgi:hypothetical protein